MNDLPIFSPKFAYVPAPPPFCILQTCLFGLIEEVITS